MSLAQLFYLKETFRTRVREWRQACFRSCSKTSTVNRQSSIGTQPSVLSPQPASSTQRGESSALSTQHSAL